MAILGIRCFQHQLLMIPDFVWSDFFQVFACTIGFNHRFFKKWSCDSELLLATVCSTAVTNDSKPATSSQIQEVKSYKGNYLDFASAELFSVTHLELYLARNLETMQHTCKKKSTFPEKRFAHLKNMSKNQWLVQQPEKKGISTDVWDQ